MINNLHSDAYEYLCRIEEAKRWMESILKEPLPAAVNLEENLCNGVYLAKLANFILPEKVPLSRIYDIFQHRYRYAGLQFHHADNINHWIETLKEISFPKIFIVEISDVYNRKNMSKIIYSIHALSIYLFSKGVAPSLHSLFGKMHFNELDINVVKQKIERHEIQLFSYQEIENLLVEQYISDVSKLQIELQHLNRAIDEEVEKNFFETLNNPFLNLAEIIADNTRLYMQAFKIAKADKLNLAQNNMTSKFNQTDIFDTSLNLHEIQGHIREVNTNCIWKNILELFKTKEIMKMKEFIASKFIHFKDYKEQNIQYYIDEARIFCFNVENLISSREIILSIIRNGNRTANKTRKVADAIFKIKQAVLNRNKEQLLSALKVPLLKLSSHVSDLAISLYLEKLSEDLNMSQNITYEDIKSSIIILSKIARINSAVDYLDYKDMWKHLSNSHLPFENLNPTLKMQYFKALRDCKKKKWIENLENSLLTFVDIQDCIDATNEKCSKQIEKKMIWGIVEFQAAIRGFLMRRNIQKLIKSIIIIQRWWRKIVKIKSFKSEQKINTEYYITNIKKVIKIQALWRGYQCRKKMPFLHQKKFLIANVSFKTLRHFVLTRQIISHNYINDLRIQTLKSSIVKIIKLNQNLARKIEEMDIKIGLLVQNRMSVEAIVNETKRNQKCLIKENDFESTKTLKKGGKRLFDGYQKLFYLLQTNPVYLTRLIVHLPSKMNHVIQNCVFSIFNYGSNSRDAYLLLSLFRSALTEEVKKFEKPIDAVTGNSLVLRLAVAFARQIEGPNPLKNILGFLIEKVLNDKVFFDINPIDIYRRWVNQMEMNCVKSSDLPQNVTQEEAMSYPEVVCLLNRNLRILKSWIKCFLDRLVTCVNQFPYSLRFIAKFLKSALLEKFPQTAENDILKIIANLIYYQYINSAIVAPDAFYIISLPPNKPMKIEQRRNLATIAKILHFASIKKGFGKESNYLMCLNPFIVECYKEMKRFCQNCCAVNDLEEYFHVTKYSEALLMNKPRIYITLEEIREFHKLLLDVRPEIASNSSDPICNILDELGDPPSLSTLMGCGKFPDENFSRAGKTQICLELNNKFQVPLEDSSEAEKLFIRTKELILRKLKNLNGETLTNALRNPEHVDIATNLTKLELAGLVNHSDDYQIILKSIFNDILREEECRRLQNQELVTLTIAEKKLNNKKKFFEDQLSHYEEYLKTCLENLTTPGKGANNKKEQCLKYSGTWLSEKGILISLNGVNLKQLKNVHFEILPTELNGIYSVIGHFMDVEIEKINIDIQELLKLQFEGREFNLFGKALINVNLFLHLLNKKFNARL